MANPTFAPPTLTGYNATPPADDGSEVASNQVDWADVKVKIGDPLSTYAAAISTGIDATIDEIKQMFKLTSAKATAYTTLAADDGTLFLVSGDTTITLLSATTAGAGYRIGIKKTDAAGTTVTIDPNASETIDDSIASKTLTVRYETIVLVSDGSEWWITNTYSPTTIEDIGTNLLRNGAMQISGRGTSFTAATTPANSDDTYLLDGWVLLSDGNDRADITQETSVIPANGDSAVKFDVETVGSPSEKFGIFQVIEGKFAKTAVGKTVTLSFKARTTSLAVENLRAHILAWDSTEDTVTSDIVSVWAVEGTNPTFVANWTAENTAADLLLTNTYTTYSVSALVDTAGTVNIGVFIHVDDTDLTATEVFYITDVKLEIGATATTFVYGGLEAAADREWCERYYERKTATASNISYVGVGFADSTTAGYALLQFKKKRAIPSIGSSGGASFSTVMDSGGPALTGIAFGDISFDAARANLTAASGFVVPETVILYLETGIANYIEIIAEL